MHYAVKSTWKSKKEDDNIRMGEWEVSDRGIESTNSFTALLIRNIKWIQIHSDLDVLTTKEFEAILKLKGWIGAYTPLYYYAILLEDNQYLHTRKAQKKNMISRLGIICTSNNYTAKNASQIALTNISLNIISHGLNTFLKDNRPCKQSFPFWYGSLCQENHPPPPQLKKE